eukprot:tig00000157_g9618.t1
MAPRSALLLAALVCAGLAAASAGAAAAGGTYQGFAIGVSDGFQAVPFVVTPAWGRALLVVNSSGDAFVGLIWTRLAKA